MMAKKLKPEDLVEFKELLMANSIQVDTLCQLLIEKGIITSEEFFTKLKQVQSEYEKQKALDDLLLAARARAAGALRPQRPPPAAGFTMATTRFTARRPPRGPPRRGPRRPGPHA